MRRSGRRRVLLLLAAMSLPAAADRPAGVPKRPPAPPPAADPQEPAPPGSLSPDGVLRDQEFARPGRGTSLKLDLFLPMDVAGPAPAVVWIHGGGWQSGGKGQCPARFLVADGYAVASISYRLSRQAIFPAQIEDCKAAVRWLRANAKALRLDPDRIGVWGASAGGHLAALLGTSGDVQDLEGAGGNAGVSSRVQAVVDWFGPTDFLQMDAHAPPDSRILHDGPASPESKLVGGPIQDRPDACKRASPLTYVTPDDPPFLIMHGDQDNLVPIHQSEILAAALRKARVETTFIPIAGAGHGFGGNEHFKTVKTFFDRHLKSR